MSLGKPACEWLFGFEGAETDWFSAYAEKTGLIHPWSMDELNLPDTFTDFR
jgi:hypothetical protein